MIIHDYLEYTEEYKKKYGQKCIFLMQVRSFYEIVIEGPVSYLRQPNRCSAQPPHGSSLHTVAYHYFAYYQGKMVRAHAFDKKMLPALMKQNAALIDYIRSHRLQPYHVGDQIRLVDYFNQHFSEPLAELAVPR